MFNKKRLLRRSALVLFVSLVGLTAVDLKAAEGAKQPPQTASEVKDIDWNKAKELMDKWRRREKLTADEQAYLERTNSSGRSKVARTSGGTESKRGSAGSREVGRILDYDPAPLPHVQLPAEHPRVWFTAKDLPELRRRCQTTHKSYFDAIIDRGIQDGGQPGIRPFNLAFLYQITGEPKYARQAIELARNVKPFGWVHPDGQSLPYGEWYAGLADPLACVFDWCYDQLSPEERKAIGGALRKSCCTAPTSHGSTSRGGCPPGSARFWPSTAGHRRQAGRKGPGRLQPLDPPMDRSGR